MENDWRQWLGFWLVMYPALLCLYIVLSAAWHVMRRESRQSPPAPTGQPLSIAVLVPARNEEPVLRDCLEALLLSDHPEPQKRIRDPDRERDDHLPDQVSPCLSPRLAV